MPQYVVEQTRRVEVEAADVFEAAEKARKAFGPVPARSEAYVVRENTLMVKP